MRLECCCFCFSLKLLNLHHFVSEVMLCHRSPGFQKGFTTLSSVREDRDLPGWCTDNLSALLGNLKLSLISESSADKFCSLESSGGVSVVSRVPS